MKGFHRIPDARLQSKIDYYMTPYNKTIHYDKHMDFDSMKGIVNLEEKGDRWTSSNKWEKLMKFITQEEKNTFRHSLSSINKGLYLELNNMIKKEVKRKLKNMELRRMCRQLQSHPRASILLTNTLGDAGRLPELATIASQVQRKQRQGKKRSAVVKKSDISVNYDILSAEITNKLISTVSHEKLSEMVEGMRKILEESSEEKDKRETTEWSKI